MGTGGGISNPLNVDTFAELVQGIANIVAGVGGVIAVIFIIYSGFLFVTARGNDKKLQDAKNTFTWTIIGTGILLGAYVIATAVVNLITSIQ